MPTYNCAPLMERHVVSMAAWIDLADEVIVVDSRSTDGTLDIIQARLRHPNLRIILRDRGLYESWNSYSTSLTLAGVPKPMSSSARPASSMRTEAHTLILAGHPMKSFLSTDRVNLSS